MLVWCTNKNQGLSGESFIYGDVVAYKCNKGLLLSGDSETICQSTGDWSIKEQTCIPVTCDLPDVPNAELK